MRNTRCPSIECSTSLAGSSSGFKLSKAVRPFRVAWTLVPPWNVIEVYCTITVVLLLLLHIYRALESMSTTMYVEADGDRTDGTFNTLLACGNWPFNKDKMGGKLRPQSHSEHAFVLPHALSEMQARVNVAER